MRNYLNGLNWDGTHRLDAWLSTYLGATNNKYTSVTGRCWMISAAARMYRPGCQADYVLSLEGEQGILKSSALAALASPAFFLDDFSDFDNKDTLLKLHRAWIVELAELSSVRRSAIDKVKAFLTCRDDIFRAPYDKRPQSHPRTNVFAASTNDTTPFSDETGNRRFWPVKCGKIDIEKLRNDRDQLWAEAVMRFKNDEKWWLDTEELNELAAEEQRKRYQGGHWDAAIERWLADPKQHVCYETDKDGNSTKRYVQPWNSSQDEVTVDDILLHAIEKPLDRRTHSDVLSVVKCLKHNHWTQTLIREGKEVRRVYRRPSVTVAIEPLRGTVTG